MRSPLLTIAPSACSMRAPNGMRCVERSRPSVSISASSPLRPIAITRPRPSVSSGRFLRTILPSTGASSVDCSRNLRRAADVEGAHGQLRARLADRLRRDHADRLALVDRRSAREIAPVAGRAHARLRLAHQRRADLDADDGRLLDRRHVDLVEQTAGDRQHLARLGIDHILGRGAARECARQG